MKKLEQQARKFAWARHEGQFRKYTLERYVHHPIDVAELVRSVPHTDEMIAAALLHDVVEDTSATLEDIEDLFGHDVADMISWLTDTCDKEKIDRKSRLAITNSRLKYAPIEVKTIKLADIIDNCSNIRELDPKFSEAYLKEKADQLTVLEEGDPILFGMAYNIIHKGNK